MERGIAFFEQGINMTSIRESFCFCKFVLFHAKKNPAKPDSILFAKTISDN
jgi:hypothetical protein